MSHNYYLFSELSYSCRELVMLCLSVLHILHKANIFKWHRLIIIMKIFYICISLII